MNKVAQEKSFISLSDAIQFLDNTVWDWGSSGWSVTEGTAIRYVNNKWQVFVNLQRIND